MLYNKRERKCVLLKRNIKARKLKSSSMRIKKDLEYDTCT